MASEEGSTVTTPVTNQSGVEPAAPAAVPSVSPAPSVEQSEVGTQASDAQRSAAAPSPAAIDSSKPEWERFNEQLAVDEDKADEPEAEAEAAEEEKPAVETEAEGVETEEATAPEPITWGDEDTPEEIADKRKALFESVDLSAAPELQGYIEHVEAQAAKAAETLAKFENIANPDTVIKLGEAVNQLYVHVDDGQGGYQVNAKPVVEFFRANMKDEFRSIAEEMLGTDSSKFDGATLIEEILIDNFGQEKAVRMLDYGHRDSPLPVAVAQLTLPRGIDDKAKEAYFMLPEFKRFEIQSLIDEVARLEDEYKDATDYTKEELAPTLRDKKEKLDTEIGQIERSQKSIDYERQGQATMQRQQAEAQMRFRNTVNEAASTELFQIADAFTADLAPRLTFVDGDAQSSIARNIMARVNSALAYLVDGNGQPHVDPTADYYAKQLREEGIKYDFEKGRSLLQQHYRATEKVENLKARGASPQALEVAKKEKQAIMFMIKSEQKVLLGQLSSKYVKSNGAAVSKQIDAVKAKKQISKVLPSKTQAATSRGPKLSPAEELKRYNAEVDRRIASGEDLYDFHAAGA